MRKCTSSLFWTSKLTGNIGLMNTKNMYWAMQGIYLLHFTMEKTDLFITHLDSKEKEVKHFMCTIFRFVWKCIKLMSMDHCSMKDIYKNISYVLFFLSKGLSKLMSIKTNETWKRAHTSYQRTQMKLCRKYLTFFKCALGIRS